LIKRQFPLRQSFLESLYGRLALDNLDFHLAIHPKHPEDPANKRRLSTDILQL
jgi:hypothetical protein